MAIATGIIVGLLIFSVGSALGVLLAAFLVGIVGYLGDKALKNKRGSGKRKGSAIGAGVLLTLGLVIGVASPLTALWGGISTAVSIIGG